MLVSSSSSKSNSRSPQASGQGNTHAGKRSNASASQAQLFDITGHAGDLNEPLQEIFSSFWGMPVEVRLLTVSPKAMNFWRHDNFYVSQASSDIHLRISDTACASLLNASLGMRETNPMFSFSTLTGLEASLLTTFSRETLTCLAKNMINAKALSPGTVKSNAEGKPAPQSVLHFVWAILPKNDEHSDASSNGIESGKLILSLPVSALKADLLKHVEAPSGSVREHWLYHALAKVDLAIGSGKIPINALEQLEVDDLLLLEESHTNQLFIIDPYTKQHLPFPVQLLSPEHITRHDLDFDSNEQDASAMSPSNDSRQALLDNLMIDVGAQFTPVKMPLHQIKQMSEGLVVEVGDLVNNEILLTVEGKALALGELVIIGDKFGVRIVSVTPDGETTPSRPVRSYPAPVPESMKQEIIPAPQAAPITVPPQQQEVQEYRQPEPEPTAHVESNDDDFLSDDFDDDDDDWN